MMLIVGLGNPGKEYINTRHNVGFLAIDIIAHATNLSLADNNKFRSAIASGEIANHKMILAKPSTFMNLSGQAVQLIPHYYKIPTSNIVVIHDDIDLELGQVKIKSGGGHAGHNGLKSIDNCLGNSYWRIRIGVGRPKHNQDVADYVLDNFSKEEKIIIDDIIHKLGQNIDLILTGKISELSLNKA
jgi:PTH1 family peptidyl-tRNA hydrolase